MRKLLFSVLFLLSHHPLIAADLPARTSSEIHRLLSDDASVGKPLYAAGKRIYSTSLVRQIYERRLFAAAWCDQNGITVQTIELLNTLQRADKEGLNPADYHLDVLSRIGAEITQDAQRGRSLSPLKLAHLDLLLTDAFLSYGRHLLIGRINPDEIEDDWRARQRSGDLIAILEEGFLSGNIRLALKNLHPRYPMYTRLRNAYDRYRLIDQEGGWDMIEKGPPLKLGDKSPRVESLRSRLMAEGDLKAGLTGEIFDGAVEKGLKEFQSRHGLDPDGKLGPTTLTALNVPVSDRVHQIEVNMERCRWLPADLGSRHIAVNVANFSLSVVDNGKEALAMKVVAGRKYRKTPVFSSTMTTIVLNPDWSVPVKIARMDILEHIREEPDYLTKHGFKVYSSYEEDAVEIDPSTIDWLQVSSATLPYRFRQNPGMTNALGRIKFLFPNEFDVYLHDTPSKELFQKTVRNFSSGCIRIEKPIELATFLLHSNDGWDRERVLNRLKTTREEAVILKDPIAVHLFYWTAWVNSRGRVEFRDDVYDRDQPLDAALHRPLEDR